jgi:hypothetical protein
VEAGPDISKGMAIIHKGIDLRAEVLLHVFEEKAFNPDEIITLSFHKKIYGAVDMSDTRSGSKINLAKQEISELIY